MHPILQRTIEVDHHVPAKDHVGFVEGSVRDEVVLCEGDGLAQCGAEQGALAIGGVIIREGPLSPCMEVVRGVLLHLRQRKDARFGIAQHVFAQIRRVDPAALEQPFLLEEDRHRVGLLAR